MLLRISIDVSSKRWAFVAREREAQRRPVGGFRRRKPKNRLNPVIRSFLLVLAVRVHFQGTDCHHSSKRSPSSEAGHLDVDQQNLNKIPKPSGIKFVVSSNSRFNWIRSNFQPQWRNATQRHVIVICLRRFCTFHILSAFEQSRR